MEVETEINKHNFSYTLISSKTAYTEAEAGIPFSLP
jgi:hypothetical protein